VLCPELDISNQGNTFEEAKRNLIEAIESFLETANFSEAQGLVRTEVFVTRAKVMVG
jgi:predicted RNase H-like HicB family nuclease